MEYLFSYGWAILVIMVIGIVLWSLGIFQAEGSQTMKGFKFIKPQLSGTSLASNGAFTGVFVNGMGSNLVLNGISINNHFDNTECTVSTFPSSVVKGGNFLVEALSCVNGAHKAGESYSLLVAISYNVTLGTVTTQHNEVGYIYGIYS